MSAEQKELIRFDPTPGFVFLNSCVCFGNEGMECCIFVYGGVFVRQEAPHSLLHPE
jgi:hypothetical protein